VLEIATLYDRLIGEQAWFRILEFLTNYIAKVPEKIQLRVKKLGVDEQGHIKRVIEYVDQRKTMVLKSLPDTISLQKLTEKLELNFKEINTIYEHKVHDYRENQKYLRLAKKHQEKELAGVLKVFLVDVVR
jgi:hypothetical protein